jgi:hypothetical protein
MGTKIPIPNKPAKSPPLVFHQILLQQRNPQSQNSCVIKLSEAENPIRYQINGANDIRQGQNEYDNRFSRYIPLGASQVIPDQWAYQSEVPKYPDHQVDSDNIFPLHFIAPLFRFPHHRINNSADRNPE